MVDIVGWIEDRYDDIVNDFNRAKDTTTEAMVTGNVNANLTRRDYGKGILGLTTVGAAGELDVYSGTADAVGDASREVGKASPFEIRSPITWKGGNNSQDTPKDNSSGNTPTDNSSGTPSTTPTPELTYDSISHGLLEESDRTQQGFKEYSLTALDDQLEGVGVEKAVENSSNYEAAIRDALEGTDYLEAEGVFRLGEYGISQEYPDGKGVDLKDQIAASDKLDQYFEELDDRGELEDQMFGYFESLEKV